MRTSLESNDTWLMVGYGVGFIVQLLVPVVWLGVAFGMVRRTSPQASRLIALAAGGHLLLGLVSPGVTLVTNRWVSTMDRAHVYRFMTLWGITGTMIGAGLSMLLVAGVVRLALAARRGAARDPYPGG